MFRVNYYGLHRPKILLAFLLILLSTPSVLSADSTTTSTDATTTTTGPTVANVSTTAPAPNVTVTPSPCPTPPCPPKKSPISILQRSRSFQNGPLAGSYVMNTRELIVVQVDRNKVPFGAEWAVYGGDGKICRLQKANKLAYKAFFTCNDEGTYIALYRPFPSMDNRTTALRDKTFFATSDESGHFEILRAASVPVTLGQSEYEKRLNNGGFLYSDYFTIVDNAYCYRWAFRLDEINAVGFIHSEINPRGSAGSYRLYELKVWILEPAAAVVNEIYSEKRRLTQSDYSRLITTRFKELGITPCIREAHHALEVISDPVWDTTEGLDEDNENFLTRHWTFRLKLYVDRMVSYLSDVTFTIKSRQLSGLYGCFIADIRVFVKAKYIVFLKTPKFKKEKINLQHSNFPTVMDVVVKEYATHLLGNSIKYVGPPWLRGNYKPLRRSYVTLFPNACISQEFVICYNTDCFVTDDWLVTQSLSPIIMPGITEEEMLIHLDEDSQNETDAVNQMIAATSASDPYTILDFAFTPTHIVALRSDSVLVLHPSDLDLKGIGVNYGTQKFRLGALVRRKWCQYSSTPKILNMYVPAFSRLGNIIMVYIVPIEDQDKLTINELPPSLECERPLDTTSSGQRDTLTAARTEAQIHENDPKQEIEASIQRRSRVEEEQLKLQREAQLQSQPQRRQMATRQENQAPDFWYFGDFLLPEVDNHFVQGARDPANVLINFTSPEFNRNVIFILDKNFIVIKKSIETQAGLKFHLTARVRTRFLNARYKSIPREVEPHQLMAFHAVEFSAVEKRFFVAVEFQSVEFRRAARREPISYNTVQTQEIMNDSSTDNDITMVIVQYDAFDLSTELPKIDLDLTEVELKGVTVPFTGCIFYRRTFDDGRGFDNSSGPSNEYDTIEEDFLSLQYTSGIRYLKSPKPLQKRTALLRTLNSALPYYVLQLGEVLIFGTLDCGFCRPLTFFAEGNPTFDQPNVIPVSKLPGSNYELIVNEEGIVSVLFRPSLNVSTQDVLIGSLLSNEPLRIIQTFIQSNTYFQMPTPQGEIIYGRTRLKGNKLAPTPGTRFLEVPFWSLLRGTVLESLGYNKFPVESVKLPPSKIGSEPAQDQSDICSFSSFDVLYFRRNFAEAGYRIRITAEVAYHGTSIPLEADLLVEFIEIQGVSVEINSALEVDNDLTIIRKTIDMSTFLSTATRQNIFDNHLSTRDGDPINEYARVFTITIRPSVLNLNCERTTYFQTIQLNVGCVPGTRIRLISEVLPLEEQPIKEFTSAVTDEQLSLEWFWNKAGDYISVPRDRVSFKQRKLFQCESDVEKHCKIPHANLIDGKVYSLSYRDSLVPKFEQFLTSHVRQITGNVVIYDLLESWKDEAARISVNTTQWGARCITDDFNWYAALASAAANQDPATRLHFHTDIYGHYHNCFSRVPAARLRIKKELDIKRAPELNRKSYWVFNQSNYNSFSLNRTRNYIYIFRAVVLNTDANTFTYCQNMDTYFALRVSRVTPQREPLTWYIYVIIIVSVLLVVFLSYIYFCYTYSWRTDLETNKARLIEEHRDRLLKQAILEQQPRDNVFKRAAERALVVAHWNALRKQDQPDLTVKTPSKAAIPLPGSSQNKTALAKPTSAGKLPTSKK